MVIHAFLKGISAKVNIIVWLESKLVYYDIATLDVNQYAMMTPQF